MQRAVTWLSKGHQLGRKCSLVNNKQAGKVVVQQWRRCKLSSSHCLRQAVASTAGLTVPGKPHDIPREKNKRRCGRAAATEQDLPPNPSTAVASYAAAITGGGVLGIAHAGATYVFEQAGLRFRHEVWRQRGLHPGTKFEAWIREELGPQMSSVDALECLLNLDVVKSLAIRPDATDIVSAFSLDKEARQGRMMLVASDITTQVRAEFPAYAKLYWAEPGRVHPAEFVRASMSIPGFFVPKEVDNLPQGPDALANWEAAGFVPEVDAKGQPQLPRKATLVDGGVLSNFPINAFHQPGVPLMPTFGVRFGRNAKTNNTTFTDVTNPLKLVTAMFASSRQILDRDFLRKNADYRQLVTSIDAEDFDWLNFNLDQRQKVELFARGAEAAARFLEGFDWHMYKETRRFIEEARKASGPAAP
ncbi:hypothetical protein WJX72_008761 [[Myrmecia] bisecta]|uniref:Patatin n=1 Tax=[Myrmecia] bisecta TaxID=41462 RepID=A0AAW1P1Z5_9CHLO